MIRLTNGGEMRSQGFERAGAPVSHIGIECIPEVRKVGQVPTIL
jgi:hypothetical protein